MRIKPSSTGRAVDPLKDMKIGIAGSSSTHDGEGRPPSFMKVIEEKTGYVAYNNSWGGAELADPSGSGDLPVATDNIYTQIKNLPLDLDMVIIQPAANDERASYPLGTFDDREITTVYGALHLMCIYLLTTYAEKPIGILTAQYSTPQNLVEKSPYHYAIEKVCGWYGIPVVNLKEEGQTPYHLPHFKSNYCRDDLHLNVEGNKILSKRVESFMRMLIGK